MIIIQTVFVVVILEIGTGLSTGGATHQRSLTVEESDGRDLSISENINGKNVVFRPSLEDIGKLTEGGKQLENDIDALEDSDVRFEQMLEDPHYPNQRSSKSKKIRHKQPTDYSNKLIGLKSENGCGGKSQAGQWQYDENTREINEPSTLTRTNIKQHGVKRDAANAGLTLNHIQGSGAGNEDFHLNPVSQEEREASDLQVKLKRRKRQADVWPPAVHHTYYPNYRSIFGKQDRDHKLNDTRDRKVTLMQLERENEASMLKQLKENQNKNIPFDFKSCFRKINFSLPGHRRKKRFGLFPTENKPILNLKRPEIIPDKNYLPDSNNDFFYNPMNSVSEPNSYDSGQITSEPRFKNNLDYMQVPYFVPAKTQTRDNMYYFNRPNNNIPLNFSDNAFKVLSQNIPLDAIQKNNNKIDKSGEQFYKFTIDNNNPGLLQNNLTKIIALLKALQGQSYLENLSGQNQVGNDRELAKTMDIETKNNLTNSNTFNDDCVQREAQKFQENCLGNNLQKSNNFAQPIINDPYVKGNIPDCGMNYKNMPQNKILVVPSDNIEGNFNMNKNYPISNYDLSLDKSLVKDIKNNFRHLAYADQLKLYDDLYNITHELHTLLVNRGSSEKVFEEGMASKEDPRHTLYQSNTLSGQVPEAKLTSNQIEPPLVQSKLSENSSQFSENVKNWAVFDMVSKMMNKFKNSNSPRERIDIYNPLLKKRQAYDSRIMEKSGKSLTNEKILGELKDGKVKRKINVDNIVKELEETLKDIMTHGGKDSNSGIYGGLTYPYPIPELRVCSTTKSWKQGCQDPVVKQICPRTKRLSESRIKVNNSHKNHFNKKEILEEIMNIITSKYKEGEEEPLGGKKREIVTKPLWLEGSHSGCRLNSRKPIDEWDDIKRQMDVVKTRKCTGCYYIYRDETPGEMCLTTKCPQA